MDNIIWNLGLKLLVTKDLMGDFHFLKYIWEKDIRIL